jgi:selenocysteine lyase/cysteine desulfurase
MPRAGASAALDLDRLRADTGAVGHITYFNNARQSPPPRPALDAVQACLTREFREGWAGLERETVIPQTRSTLAALLGADQS